HTQLLSVILTISAPALSSSSLFHVSVHHRDLHSFPTRRSSDLIVESWNTRMEQLFGALRRDAVGRRLNSLLPEALTEEIAARREDRKSTRLNSSHGSISYAVFCLKKKKQ